MGAPPYGSLFSGEVLLYGGFSSDSALLCCGLFSGCALLHGISGKALLYGKPPCRHPPYFGRSLSRETPGQQDVAGHRYDATQPRHPGPGCPPYPAPTFVSLTPGMPGLGGVPS